jgi:FtsH-binding integral membrane protein
MTTIYYSKKLLVYAALLTALMVSGLTLYACTTKTDFTMMGGLLFVGSMVLLGAGIAQIFL